MPTGLTVSRINGNASCQITGTPRAVSNRTTYTVTATNATGADTTPATVSITVGVTPTASTVKATTASISVPSTATGTAYVIFLPRGAAAPTAAVIKAARAGSAGVVAANSMAVTAGTQATVSLSGLDEDTEYDAYIVVESDTGTLSTVMKVDVDTPMLVRPNLTNVSAASLTVGERATITFDNDGGDALTSCTVAPGLPSDLTVSRTSDNISCQITGIPRAVSDPVTYTVTATNAIGADTTPATVSISVMAAPVPTATSVTATTASINVPSNTTGTAYVIFLPNGSAPPTAAAIKAARAGAAGVVAASSMAVTAGAQATVSLTDLMGNTEYDAYIVVESSSGGFGTVMKVDVVTPSTPSVLARPNLANASTASSFTVMQRAAAITFTNNGGGSLTNCAVNPPLPTGLTVSRTTGNASCQIIGTPTIVRSRTTYRVTATNATGADTTPASVAITVMAAPVLLARPNLANASAASLTAGTRAATITFTNNGGGSLTNCAVNPPLPTGLTVSRTSGNASCQIAGAPRVVSGQTTYTVTATNATGMGAATVAITVAPARPRLVNASAASFTAGTEAATIAFTNNGGGSLTNCGVSPPLPTGLNVLLTDGNASCRITGTPSVASDRTTYTVTATNATGMDTATVSIAVAPARPNLDNTAATLTVGDRATIAFTNNGGGSLTNCRVNTTLPTGLSVSRTNGNGSCQITGTPNAVSVQTTYTVTATNVTGSDTADVSIVISVSLAQPDLANASASDLTAGSRATIAFTNGGGGALTSCEVNPPLPSGLSVSRTNGNASCQIAGTPVAVSGQTTYTVTATNATGMGAATVSITVAPARPNLANASAASLIAGTRAATIAFTNNGGESLTTCAVNPPLPTGLNVSRTNGNASCQITGIPTAVTSVDTYTVTATNATGSDMATVSITVAPALPNLANATAATLVVGTEATILFTNNGGGALTNCAVDKTLPAGLSASLADDNASCRITGTPSVASDQTTYTVTATNVTGMDTATVSISVVPARPSLANASAASLIAGTRAATIAFTNNGGGALTNCAVNPPLPTGLTVSRTNGNASCEIIGTPSVVRIRTTYTVTATNVTGMGAATVSITVAPARPSLANASAANLIAGTEAATIVFTNNGGESLTNCAVNPPLPTGLNVSRTNGNASCQISGTPSVVRNRTTYTVTATNVTGADTATVSITVAPARPSLANASAASLISGTRATTITFTNNGGGSLTNCGVNPPLPTGLNVSRTNGNASCQIAGTPSVVSGRTTYTVTATNVTGMDTVTVSITVVPARPSLANAPAANLIAGTEATTITFINNGGESLTNCGVNPPLPTGLMLSLTSGNTSCQIAGTPDAATAVTTYTVTATNATGTDMATVAITVAPARPSLADASANLKTGDRATITFTNNGGGALTRCTVNSSLPTGLTLDRTSDNASCEIIGTPTAVSVQTTYTVTATNVTGSDTADVSITVAASLAQPALANVGTANLTVGEPATITFANGGGGSLTSCRVNTTLPTGLMVSRTNGNASCQITGTPDVVSGQTAYTVTATNATGNDTATVAITVAPARPDLADAAAASFIAGTEITAISFINNGGRMLTNCAVNPPLPTGLMVSRTNSDASCQIAGTPSVASGQTTYTVTATNVTSMDTATVSITVAPARPDLANASAANFIADTEATTIAFINNGGGALTNCAVNPPLPTGLNVSLTDDNASCRIAGTPSVVSGQTTHTVTATNVTGMDTATVSITVAPARPDLANAVAANFIAGTEITAISFTNNGGGMLTNCAVNPPLPTGLMVSRTTGNASCQIAGTPSVVSGRTTYTVTATNVTGNDAATVSITVEPARPSLANASAANFTAGTEATTIAFTNGGGGMLTNCAVNPLLPTGLMVSRTNGNASCQIAGTPSVVSGRTTYTVTATNATGMDTATVSIAVVPARPNLANAPAANFIADTEATTITFTNNGGGALTNCEVNPPLPTGLMVSRTNSNASCQIAGTPSVASSRTIYRVTATNVTGADATPATVAITVTVAQSNIDADGDGLIDISTLEQLNNVRYSLDGTGYKTSASATPVTTGCPNNVCQGYELTDDLDFDTDDDGTWVRNSDGSYTLDTDDDSDYFDIASDGSSGGWMPIGDCGADGLCFDDTSTSADETLDNAPFTAIFDGDGHTISGLASVRDLVDIGLFGAIDTGADIRNLGLVGNFAKYAGTSDTHVGGLVGYQVRGSITDSYATGDVAGGVGDDDEVGGLVGFQLNGSITGSHATGNVSGGGGSIDNVGGLVGQQHRGSITGSHATGNADAGGDEGIIGGLVGVLVDGSIIDSYATGDANGSSSDGDEVGGLVGRQSGGSITASHATGDADGGDGDYDDVGGLVGYLFNGTITASHATGDADGGEADNDSVGGLVGTNFGGSITASRATGGVGGGNGDGDRVGGLVGYQSRGSIIASHAIGDADGGNGVRDLVGSLVGWQRDGAITASWGFGNLIRQELDGSDGSSDLPAGIVSASGLTSANVPASWNAAASSTLGAWDLGTATQAPALSYADYDGAPVGTAGSYTSGHLFHCASDSANAPDDAVLVPNCGTLIPSVTAANVLVTRADINVISSVAGTTYVAVLADGTMAPAAAAIKAATAGSGGVVAVGNAAVTASARATVSLTGLMESSMYDAYVVIESGGVLGSVTKVNVNTRAIVSVANVMATATDINVLSGTSGTAYVVALANGAMAPTAAAIKAAVAGSGGVVAAGNSAATAGVRATVSLTGLTASTMYDVYMVVESGGVLGTVTKIDLDTLRVADADGNGLIEIGTLAELNNVRYNPAGTGYQDGPGTATSTSGCPVDGCRGYELTTDLDFDADGDGNTWTRNSDGSVTLDTGDDNDDYFDIASDGSSGGWAPIGDFAGRFTAVFDGGGHTISGLATVRDLSYIGLFGVIFTGADIRNLGLVGNLAKSVGSGFPRVGGLVGLQGGGSITASYATGDADGGDGDYNYVGGLVGIQSAGPIAGSHATGNTRGGRDSTDYVGGLVGLQGGGSITASYADGDADAGGGADNFADYVGGLVGLQGGGTITASHATGDADGGAGGFDYVGGLVGRQSGGFIITSYATGDADGGAGDFDYVGGLVGEQFDFRLYDGDDSNDNFTNSQFDISVIASYATGDAVGGGGFNDFVGGLVGFQGGGSITASYANGDVDGGGGLVGGQLSSGLDGRLLGIITASWGFGSAFQERQQVSLQASTAVATVTDRMASRRLPISPVPMYPHPGTKLPAVPSGPGTSAPAASRQRSTTPTMTARPWERQVPIPVGTCSTVPATPPTRPTIPFSSPTAAL